MAKYLLMKKVSENNEAVVYKFGPDEKTMGTIEFSKAEQRFLVLESVNDGLISNKAYEDWAAQRIIRAAREDGAFPDTMSVEA